ncbi:MAG TPA: redoxin family protein [Candidatus Eisenbacteria bacterium]
MNKTTWLVLTAFLWLFGNDSGSLAQAAVEEMDDVDVIETVQVDSADDDAAAGSGGGKTAASDVTHPGKAECAVCTAKGGAHGVEKVAGMSQYQGAWYYFCSADCKKEFDADPASFVVLPLPRPAPEINVHINGEDLPLSEFKGSVVLIDFWATWCKPCVKMMPNLQKLYDKKKLEGLTVLGISIDEDAGKAVTMVADKDLTYPIVIDTGERPSWKAFGVKAIPATFLVDADGKIVAQWTGNEIKWDKVEKEVERVVAESKARSN